jgi:hypothetical protein
MKPTNLIIKLHPQPLLLLVALWLAGCSSTPSGHIYVDHPEVFTRERLVDRRLADLQWLESKLNQQINPTFQGGRSQSQFTGFTGQLTAQFDPLAAAGAAGNLQTVQSAQQATQLQNQLVTTALQQKLQDLQNGTLHYNTVLGSNTVPVTNLTSGNGTFTATLPSGTNVPMATSNLPGVSNLVMVSNNSIQLTATERFQDQLAYRDAVSAEMRERELDDTHDRVGMTLYTLKFDLSVIPGKQNRSLGQSDLTLVTKPADASDKKGCAATNQCCTPAKNLSSSNIGCANPIDQYDKWVMALRRNFDTEVISVQRRFRQHFLTADEERRLTIRSWEELASAPGKIESLQLEMNALELRIKSQGAATGADSKTNRSIEHLSEERIYKAKANELTRLTNSISLYHDLAHHWRSWHDSPNPPDSDTDAILQALASLVTAQFANALKDSTGGNLVTFGGPRLANSERGDFRYLVPVESYTNEACALVARIDELQKKTKSCPFVYAAEPKESAQNLSDVSAKQSALNLSASLAAAIPQLGTSIGTYVNYLKQNQYLLETIKREPLLVSYIRNETNFGWIVGPRFKIREKKLKLDYEHIPVQESVQATIAVPAWLPAVTIIVSNRWLGSNGELAPRTRPETQKYEVRLRPDMDALTRALLEDSDPVWFGSPQINPRWDCDPRKQGYVLQAGQPAQLLILGRNLWRNPKIFIGSQGTTTEYDYTILPDMQGLVARIPSILPIPSLPGGDGKPAKVDLRVVTSDGEAVLKDAVTILSGTPAGAVGSFVGVLTNWAVAGASTAFALSTSQAPEDYVDYELYLAPNGTDMIPVATNASPQGAQLGFTLPNGGIWANPTRALVNVKLRTSPQKRPVSVLNGGEQPIVVFTSAAQSQFHLSNASVNVPTNSAAATNITILPPDPGTNPNLPDLFWAAWPGLDGGSALLQLTPASGPPVILSDINKKPLIMCRECANFGFSINSSIAASLGVTAGNPVSCQATLITPAPPAAPRWQIPAGAVTISIAK